MTTRVSQRFILCLVLLSCAVTSAVGRSVSEQDDPVDTRAQSAEYAHSLSSFDPLERQRAAEGLARLAAVDQRKLVSGYVLQEKNKKVKLALNWALYRMGKAEALFEVVRDLDSARHDQAADYLTHLETPQPLYLFLPQDTTSSKVRARLLEVLGQIGDAETLNQIKPFNDSFDPKVSQAAQFATNQIQHRLDQPATDTKARPRVVGRPDQPPR